MGRDVTARAPVKTPAERRLALRQSLVASGVAPAVVLPTADLSRMSTAERYFVTEGVGNGYANWAGDHWPTETDSFDATGAVFRDGPSAVFRGKDGTLAHIYLGGGWFHVQVASPNVQSVFATISQFRAAYPPSYLMVEADARVPITFWTCGPFGATSRLRRLDSASWESIAANYTATVRDELAGLMEWTGPEREGQLFLWQGPPGTGKTWALRALASRWNSWAEFHYITDPDVFFVERPSYMIDVLLSESYDVIDASDGSIVSEPGEKWRVLILEDTGELLSATAKEKYGQGLSRLLNVVDGMIGQGLRVLAIITTNDELGELAPAATRPGRCVSHTADGAAGPTVFGPLTAEEAQAWLNDPDAEAGTLAELYARRGDPAPALEDDDEAEEVVDEAAAMRRLVEMAARPL